MMKDRKKKKKIHDRIRGKFSQASNKRRTKFFGDHLAFKSRLFLHGNFNTQHVILCAVVDTENDPRSTVIWIGRKKKKTNLDSHLLPVYHCHAYQQMPQIWLKFYIWSTDNIARKKKWKTFLHSQFAQFRSKLTCCVLATAFSTALTPTALSKIHGHTFRVREIVSHNERSGSLTVHLFVRVLCFQILRVLDWIFFIREFYVVKKVSNLIK